MILVEYKKHLVNGASVDPEWIIIGGMLYNEINNTYIGFVQESQERDYYIPNTLITMTDDDIIERAKTIHAEVPFKKAHLEGEPTMSEDEVVEMISKYIQDVRERI